MFRLKLTEEQIIARIRHRQRLRRPVGIACILLGVAFVVVMAYIVDGFRAQALEMWVPADARTIPTTMEDLRAENLVHQNTGYVLGFAMGLATMSGGLLFGIGVARLLPFNRKDRLLLRLWDHQHAEQTDTPAENDATHAK